MRNKPELLSPAGSMEKLKAALLYGADAVYLAGTAFGMRSAAANFNEEELASAITLAHQNGKRVYLTVNTMPREEEYPSLLSFLSCVSALGPDAYIIGDLGVFSCVRRMLPDAEIHVSTQMSCVSSEAARMWHSLGAKRIVLARELTLSEIRAIREAVPEEVELEVFIHGSMCVSYSGRCLLSNYFTGRDGNRGQCAQPCRWNYRLTEEFRPDDPVPVEETADGTFIMSSKDLCMIEHVPELVQAGIDSFKIEGRMKSAYYTAVVTNSYRIAIDRYCSDPEGYRFDPVLLEELESVSHREYATGYFFDRTDKNAQTVSAPGYLREKAYLAVATGYDPETGRASFLQRNKVVNDTEAELLSPGQPGRKLRVSDMRDAEGCPIPSAPHPFQVFSIPVPFPVREGDILRS